MKAEFNLTGDLGKPASVLIERVCNGAWALVEPIRAVYKARMENWSKGIELEGQLQRENKLIQAEAEQERLRLQADFRIEAERLRHQQSLNTLALKASYYLKADAQPEKISPDWLELYIDKGKRVHDEHFQEIWAKLLADEANEPGTYSKRTLSILQDMESSDAKALQALSRFTCILTTSDNTTARCPIIWNMAASPLYQEYGLKYEKIRDLESIGLISIADYSHLFGTNDKELKNFAITVEYFSDSETITFKDNTHQKMVRIGSVMLTKWGAELIRVCEPGEEVPEFLQRALKVMLGKSERI